MNSGEAIVAMEQAFGLVTTEMIEATLGLSPRAARRSCRELVALGRFRRHGLFDGRCYWTRRGALGTQALITRYAVMFRCCRCGGGPWMPERRDGPAMICRRGQEAEAVFVDFGAEAAHVGRKIRRFCVTRELAGLTAYTVVVAEEGKADAVHRVARRHRLPLPIRFVICVDLGEMLAHAAR